MEPEGRRPEAGNFAIGRETKPDLPASRAFAYDGCPSGSPQRFNTQNKKSHCAVAGC